MNATKVNTAANITTTTTTRLRILVAIMSVHVGLEYQPPREHDHLPALEAHVAVLRIMHEGMIDLRFNTHVESRIVGTNRVNPGRTPRTTALKTTVPGYLEKTIPGMYENAF